MKRTPSEEFLEKAKLLSRDEAEQILSRMRKKLLRRMEDKDMTPLNAVALQLEKEADDLDEWRARWAEIAARESRKKEK